jgi:peroxiredoxin
MMSVPWLLLLALTPATDKLEVGQPAPMFALPGIDEKKQKQRFALGDLVGDRATQKKRAVVLSFAASYCEPCKKELAEFKKLKPKLDASNVVLAVVVIDKEPDGIEKMRKLTVDELALEYPVLLDRFGLVAKRYFANTLPLTVVVKPDGTVQWLNSGFQPDAIDRLLGELAIAKK